MLPQSGPKCASLFGHVQKEIFRKGSFFPVDAEIVERRLLDPKADFVIGSYELSFLIEVSHYNAGRLEVVSKFLSGSLRYQLKGLEQGQMTASAQAARAAQARLRWALVSGAAWPWSSGRELPSAWTMRQWRRRRPCGSATPQEWAMTPTSWMTLRA